MSRRETQDRSRHGTARPLALPVVVTMCASVVLAACSADAAPREDSGPTEGKTRSAVTRVVSEQVSATVETEPVPHDGDAADDPAVWVDPDDPSTSAIIGTDKQGGLLVYDLAGRQLQYLEVGDMNNVDVLPEGFTLGGRPAVLVVSGNRSSNTVGVFELDPDTRQLRDVAGTAIEPDLEVYGSCLYRSAGTGKVYAFVNSEAGEVEQWELTDDGSGRVVGERVRSFGVESQTEGCVADAETGRLYLGEEARGIWRFGAEPDGGDTGSLIAEVSSSGPLVADVEGLAIVPAADGTGFLIASSQGDNSYAVFRLEGDNSYVGSFRIGNGDIDGTSDTDGIDVVATPLGASFPSGVFVAQDGDNDEGTQNFKLVPLEQIFPD
jgi:3-phytase